MHCTWPTSTSCSNIASPSSAAQIATSPVQPASQQRPQVEAPFWVTFMFGNVSHCNGCKGRIAHDPNKKALPPPDDIVLQHKEYVVYQNSRTGYYEQSRFAQCILPSLEDMYSILFCRLSSNTPYQDKTWGTSEISDWTRHSLLNRVQSTVLVNPFTDTKSI